MAREEGILYIPSPVKVPVKVIEISLLQERALSYTRPFSVFGYFPIEVFMLLQVLRREAIREDKYNPCCTNCTTNRTIGIDNSV